MSNMKRRNFLGLAGAAAAIDPFGRGTALAGEIVGAASLPDWDAMSAIGRRYLDSYPEEAENGSLLLARLGAFRQWDRERLRQAIRADMRRDLDGHEIVAFEGWILPRTLLRLCSAVAIADRNHVC